MRGTPRWLAIAAAFAAGCGGGNGGSDGSGDATGGGDDAAPADARADGAIGPGVYETDFDGDESPLSEGGAWSHVGLDWATVAKSGGIAYGTQTGTGGYDDAYAVLSGFPADHAAAGVIHLIDNIDASCTHEVEILLRWSDAAHDAHGYECNISFDGGYSQIMRWNGPFGDFTPLGAGSYPGLADGDRLEASITGTTIIISVNGTEVARADDPTFSDGNPGVAFFRRECGAGTDFGFTHYRAQTSPF